MQKAETRTKRKLGESGKVGEVLGQPKKKKVIAEERNEGDGDMISVATILIYPKE